MEIKTTVFKTQAYLIELQLDQKIVARAYVYVIRNKLHKRPYALLEDVFVDEEYRGRGIGKMIVKKAISLAKELGCYKIIATSRFPREPVHRFYESLGFRKWGYEFRRELKNK